MKCRRAARLLHRCAGGDLDPRRTSRVAEHVSGCASCRSLERELAASLALLRAAVPEPLSSEVRAEIKKEIWSAIEKRRARDYGGGLPVPGPPFAWAIAAAAALFLALALARREPARSPREPRLAASPRPTPAARPASAIPLPRVAPPPVERASAESSEPPWPRRTGRRAIARDGVTRIEIATPDPNVRIIWLFRQGPGLSRQPSASRTEEVS